MPPSRHKPNTEQLLSTGFARHFCHQSAESNKTRINSVDGSWAPSRDTGRTWRGCLKSRFSHKQGSSWRCSALKHVARPKRAGLEGQCQTMLQNFFFAWCWNHFCKKPSKDFSHQPLFLPLLLFFGRCSVLDVHLRNAVTGTSLAGWTSNLCDTQKVKQTHLWGVYHQLPSGWMRIHRYGTSKNSPADRPFPLHWAV